MPERVYTEHEISLNAVKYPILGPVKTFKASVYPSKDVIGEYSEASNPLVSVVSWSNFSGGPGLYRIRSEADLKRCQWSTCTTRKQADIRLGARDVDTPVMPTSEVPDIIGELPTGTGNAGEIYVVTTARKIYKYKDPNNGTSSDAWGSALVTLTAAATDQCNVELAGTYYLVFACTTQTAWSSDGAAWTDNGQDSLYVVAWDDKLWGITSAGQLWYTTNLTAFTNDAKLPTATGTVKALFVGPDAYGEPIIYAMTTYGLFAHDFANARFVPTGFVHAPAANYAKPSVWEEWIVIPIEELLWFYNPRTGEIRGGGPYYPDGAPPTDSVLGGGTDAFTGTPIVGLTTQGPRLICIASKGISTAGNPLVAASTGTGWEALFANNQSYGLAHPVVSYAYSANRLWYHGNTRLHYIPLPDYTALPSTYKASGILATPWFDGFQQDVTKVAIRLRVRTANSTATETIAVGYSVDYATGASTSLGTISTNGLTTYSFPNSTTPTGTAFHSIRLDFTLARGGTNTASPSLVSVSLDYEKVLTVLRGWDVIVDLTQDYDEKNVQELRAALNTAIDSSTKVEFTFRDDTASGNPRNYYVRVLSPESEEETGREEKGMMRLRLVQS